MKRHNKNYISRFFHCKVCNKEMKYKSKHSHIKSKEHLKILEESGSTEEDGDVITELQAATEETGYAQQGKPAPHSVDCPFPDPDGLDFGLCSGECV